MKELPEPTALLGDLELSKQFSAAERVDVMKGQSQSRRAEKLLDYLETKSSGTYEVFLRVLRKESPLLAARLSEGVSEAEGPSGSKCKLL